MAENTTNQPPPAPIDADEPVDELPDDQAGPRTAGETPRRRAIIIGGGIL